MITDTTYMFTLNESKSYGVRKFYPLCLCTLLLCVSSLSVGCSRKSGCPINEPATMKTDKKGNFKSDKGASNLFPKDMRKRVKKS